MQTICLDQYTNTNYLLLGKWSKNSSKNEVKSVKYIMSVDETLTVNTRQDIFE